MEIKLLKWIASSLTLLAMTLSSVAGAYTWQEIDTGLSYTNINGVDAFQIDPKFFKFSILTAKDIGDTDTTVQMLGKKSKAVLIINGGFFSPEHKSLGLLVRSGQILNPFHSTPWWGIFQIIKGKASIISPRQFQPSTVKQMEMAVQVGPRLVVNGAKQKLKPSISWRSGIGIQENGDIIIAATRDKEMSMEDFADLFLKSQNLGGLECIDALNLDGGSSTQLYFNLKGSKIDIPGRARIANGVAVFVRP